jgi:hypothetical protein
MPHTCNIYPTYTEIKPDYPVQNFQTTETTTEIDDPLKMRRMTNRYDNSRTLYENPSNIRNDVNRTPLRSPNYLALETRTYDTNGCSNPRNVLNSSPRTYIPDVSSNYESNPLDKPRLQNAIYSENQIAEYSGYCENSQFPKYESKDEYVSALHTAIANVQSIDNIRSTYNDGACAQYSQNCERMFPYPGLTGKKMEQMRKMQRCRTPEILLAPHYLEGCNRQVCCHWGPPYT